jgi:hypothetical protein
MHSRTCSESVESEGKRLARPGNKFVGSVCLTTSASLVEMPDRISVLVVVLAATLAKATDSQRSKRVRSPFPSPQRFRHGADILGASFNASQLGNPAPAPAPGPSSSACHKARVELDTLIGPEHIAACDLACETVAQDGELRGAWPHCDPLLISVAPKRLHVSGDCLNTNPSCVKYKTDCHNTEWNPWGHWCVMHNGHTTVGLCAPSECDVTIQQAAQCDSVGAPAWFWWLIALSIVGVFVCVGFCVWKKMNGGYSAM